MEIARLVLDYIKVFIWPATTIVIVIAFRSQLTELVHRVRTLSAPGVDAEFSARVVEVSEDAEAVVQRHTDAAISATTAEAAELESGTTSEPVEVEDPRTHTPGISGNRLPRILPGWDAMYALAVLNPERGLLRAYSKLEDEVTAKLESPDTNSMVPGLHWETLRWRFAMPADISAAIDELRMVRNDVAHNRTNRSTLSSNAALAFVTTCQDVVKWLQSNPRTMPTLF